MSKLIQGIFAAGVLCGAAGCLSTVDTVENAEKTYVTNEVLRKHVETDASTPIKVYNLIDAVDPNNGFLKISVEFINRSSSPAASFYRVVWYDQNGMPVTTSLSQWTELRLLGRDTAQVNFTAPNAQARDYKIRLFENP